MDLPKILHVSLTNLKLSRDDVCQYFQRLYFLREKARHRALLTRFVSKFNGRMKCKDTYHFLGVSTLALEAIRYNAHFESVL